jgi:hypothetical protein
MGCPRCGVLQQILIFPAFFRPNRSPKAGRTAFEGESSCFFHLQKRPLALRTLRRFSVRYAMRISAATSVLNAPGVGPEKRT